MSVKLRKVDALKAGDVFAMRHSYISYLTAKVLCVEIKDDLEVQITYEFSLFGKTYPRRDLLPRNTSVMMR